MSIKILILEEETNQAKKFFQALFRIHGCKPLNESPVANKIGVVLNGMAIQFGIVDDTRLVELMSNSLQGEAFKKQYNGIQAVIVFASIISDVKGTIDSWFNKFDQLIQDLIHQTLETCYG